jgi:hypothetical protein
MAKKDDEWLVTHLVTAERIERESEGWGFFDYVGAAVVAVIGFLILHAILH